MASSRRHSPILLTQHDRIVPARTPGPLGVNDYADPNALAQLGDIPGSVGVNDRVDPTLRNPGQGNISIVLLDRTRVARFLRSVAYIQATAEMVRVQKESKGLWFSSTEVETGNEPAKERLVDEKMDSLTQEFAEACSHGSKAAMQFLRVQEAQRTQAAAKIEQVFSAARQSNQATAKSLERWVASLKTAEYAAGTVITVAGLFVSASAALLAGIIGFAYDTATTVIDDHNGASAMDADCLALASTDVAKEAGKSALKEKAKDVVSGKDLEAVEKLEQKVAHLHEKIAMKQAMIHETSSQHNISRLTRSIGRDETELSRNVNMIGRFRGVTFLFAAWDLFDRGGKIRNAWRSE
jgi:hypothetical protein